MVYINHIYNEDCMKTMQKLPVDSVDVVLTSPPYNTARTAKGDRALQNRENRYDVFVDKKTPYEYAQWTVDVFNGLDKVLKKDGVVLYNISYGADSPNSMWMALMSVLRETRFMIADSIVWKKRSALPNNTSPNKLTRICENIFVLVRKNEYSTYHTEKKLLGVNAHGQKNYESVPNFIEAPNNDGANDLNKATFSSVLCEQLLNLYSPMGGVVYDPFMGTGTTAVAAKRIGMKFIGSELSKAQCEYATRRLRNTLTQKSLF